MGVPLTGEITTLVERGEVVEEGMGDGMDEEGGVRRVLERLREMEGAQGIIVSAILEVYIPFFFLFATIFPPCSWFSVSPFSGLLIRYPWKISFRLSLDSLP